MRCQVLVGTPYEGGVFRCALKIDDEFPQKPPKGYFLTKIFHPNVSLAGEICVNTLKKDWEPANWSLRQIFEVLFLRNLLKGCSLLAYCAIP